MNAKIGVSVGESGIMMMDDEKLALMLQTLPDIKLTKEQVMQAYTDWYSKLDGDETKKATMMQLGAGMIYRNGLHKNTGSQYKVSAEYDWGTVKAYLGLVDRRKLTITRFLIGVMKEIHAININPQFNIIVRSCEKYGLITEYEAISPTWAFWGAYLHPEIPDADAKRIYDLQQEIIDEQKKAATAQQTQN
jgi:hypothetical protein